MAKRTPEAEKILQPTQVLNQPVTEIPFEYILSPDDGVPASSILIQLISEWGLINPILVVLDSPGRYKIVAGRRRWDAIRQIREVAPIRFMTVPVKVITGNVDDLSVSALTILENHSRSDNPLADALAIRELQLKGVSADEIYEATGLMKAQQNLKLSLLQLTPELIGYLKDGTLSVKLAEKIAILPKETQERVVMLARERWEVSAGKKQKISHNDYREVKMAKRIQVTTDLFAQVSDNLAAPDEAQGEFLTESEAREKADASVPAWFLRSKQEIMILRAMLKRVKNQDKISQLLQSLEDEIEGTAKEEGLRLPGKK